MTAIRLYNNKILLKPDGKAAISENCCCPKCCCVDGLIDYSKKTAVDCEAAGGTLVACPYVDPCSCKCNYQSAARWNGETVSDWFGGPFPLYETGGWVPNVNGLYLPVVKPLPGLNAIGPYHYVYVGRTVRYACAYEFDQFGFPNFYNGLPIGVGPYFIASVSIWAVNEFFDIYCSGGYFKEWLFRYQIKSVDEGMCPDPTVEPVVAQEVITPPPIPPGGGGICLPADPESVMNFYGVDVSPYVQPPTITLDCSLDPITCEK